MGMAGISPSAGSTCVSSSRVPSKIASTATTHAQRFRFIHVPDQVSRLCAESTLIVAVRDEPG